MESFQSVVQAVLFERLEVPKLHPANVAGEEFVRWESGAMILLSVFDVRRSVAVALPALLANKGFVDGTQGTQMLQSGVLFQEPDGRESGSTGGAAEHFFAQESWVH